jgi:hypothetical protein
MDYLKIYNQIVKRGQTRVLPEGTYTEKHHIKPKCMGGSNDKSNLTTLTAREHYIVHKLLVEIYPNDRKIFHAFWAMATFINEGRTYHISSREMERLKIEYSLNHPHKSPEYKAKASALLKDKSFEDRYGEEKAKEIKEKISIHASTRVGDKNPFFEKNHNEKTRNHWSKIRKGVKPKPESVEKARQTMLSKGENHHMKTPEMRALTSKNHKGKKQPTTTGENNPAKRPEVRAKLAMGNNAAARIVMDIKTGIFYECAKEAALLYNMKSSKLTDWLRNETRNKTSLRYV